MTNEELRSARERLGLTPAETATMMEVDTSSVHKWERDPTLASARPAPARVVRLMNAYLSGYRPDDWPERLRDREARRAEMEQVRTVARSLRDD